MPLPDLIEIIPLPGPVRAEVTIPGSKSITNRALLLAALAEGEIELGGALWSEDTQIMVECLQELGFMVNVAPDPAESCNRFITVYGQGGRVPPGGTAAQPLNLFVGNAGTAARFLSALVCLGSGVYRLHGIPRMHERPQSALFNALRQLGYRIEPERNETLPALIHGGSSSLPFGHRRCSVSIQKSSQFASALLLCAAAGGWEVNVVGENAEESPYVAMTKELIAAFPQEGGRFEIEPDASSGSYFRGVNWLFTAALDSPDSPRVSVADWPTSSWQIDGRFPPTPSLPEVVSRRSDLGDSIMTAIVLAPLGDRPRQFIDLGRLRVQECERVVALRTELAKCGALVEELGETLSIRPSQLQGTEIETYNDHRMAMCFATLGLKVPGMKIRNPSCVKKTFPNFFQKLAAPPPQGLGARIIDARSGAFLRHADLFAD